MELIADHPILEHHAEDSICILVVKPVNLFDDVAERLRRDFIQIFQETSPEKVILNLERVEMISSASVGAIVGMLKRVKEKKGQMVLCGLKAHVAYVMKLCRLIEPETGMGVFLSAADVPGAIKMLS